MKKSTQITRRILIALVLGIVLGTATRNFLSEEGAKQAAGYYALLTEIFLRLIKMIIARSEEHTSELQSP